MIPVTHPVDATTAPKIAMTITNVLQMDVILAQDVLMIKLAAMIKTNVLMMIVFPQLDVLTIGLIVMIIMLALVTDAALLKAV